jgi:uncharacterized membrane protein YbhN (UPF0104 family)
VRTPFLFILKLVIGLAILAFVLMRVDVDSIWSATAALSPTTLVIALALTFVAHFINAVKLRIFLPHLSIGQAVRFTLIAVFYGTALPGQLAGDAVKALRLARASDADAGAVMGAVTVDKVIGLFALLLLTALGLGLSQDQFSPGVTHAALAATILAAFGLIAILVVPLPARFGQWSEKLAAWRSLTLTPKTLVTALTVGLVFQMFCIALFAVVGAALGVNLPITSWAVVVGLIGVVLLLPLTVAGIGLRDGTLLTVLGALGQSEAAAIALSFSLLALTIVAALVGFVVDVMGKDR